MFLQLIQTNLSSMYQGIKILESIQFRKWILVWSFWLQVIKRYKENAIVCIFRNQNTYYALLTHQQVQRFLCNLNLHLINGSYLIFATFHFKILFYIKFEINSKKNRKGSGKQNQRYQINRIWWDFAVQSQHFLGIPINCRWNLITALYCRSFPR